MKQLGWIPATLFTTRLALILSVGVALFQMHPPQRYGREVGRLLGNCELGRSSWAQSELVVTLALRLIPFLEEEQQRLRMALAARGVEAGHSRLDMLRNQRKLLFPLILNAFRRADHVSLALEARGWDPRVARTSLQRDPLSRREGVVTALFRGRLHRQSGAMNERHHGRGRRGNTTTYRLDLEYDGTDFCGWQIQPHERTVQQCLEEAVRVLFGETISVMGAGRTDAGVHATGQVASFRSTSYRPPQVVERALNAMLPPDVRVKAVSHGGTRFSRPLSAPAGVPIATASRGSPWPSAAHTAGITPIG